VRFQRHVALAGLLAVASSTACVQFVYERVNLEEPIRDAAWKPLRPGADLQQCLDELGAPFRVQTVTKREFELIYRWYQQSEWGLRVSYNFSRGLGVSYNFNNAWADIPALRLRFGTDCRLLDVTKGLLGDFVGPNGRRRELRRFGEAKQRVR